MEAPGQPAPAPSLRVLRATDHWVVVDKPPGLLSVPGKGHDKADCVPARIAAMFPSATGPLVVHRLDMDTSGLLVVGLTPEAQRALSRQFEDRAVRKAYVALVDGVVESAEAGTIDLPMRLDPHHRPWQVIDYVHGRAAITHWRIMSIEARRTRLRLEPQTGRSHQLRVHCATALALGGLGRAIVGDVLYGCDYRSAEAVGRLVPAPRLMLHASELEFTDPQSGERVSFESAPEF
jgi:tRNA pseudouridine32 synthase/23S rRNA pseudouridine746 synthase